MRVYLVCVRSLLASARSLVQYLFIILTLVGSETSRTFYCNTCILSQLWWCECSNNNSSHIYPALHPRAASPTFLIDSLIPQGKEKHQRCCAILIQSSHLKSCAAAQTHWSLRVSQPGVNPFIALYDLVHASSTHNSLLKFSKGCCSFCHRLQTPKRRFSTPPLSRVSLHWRTWSFQSEIYNTLLDIFINPATEILVFFLNY